jgi:hypothetical protein
MNYRYGYRPQSQQEQADFMRGAKHVDSLYQWLEKRKMKLQNIDENRKMYKATIAITEYEKLEKKLLLAIDKWAAINRNYKYLYVLCVIQMILIFFLLVS